MRFWLNIFILLWLATAISSCSALRLCPVPGCQVRMEHAHNGVTFRGQPWWRIKKQNPKVGQAYVYTKDKNLIKKAPWWASKKKKDEDKGKKSTQLAGIKARDPSHRRKEKDLEVEEPEEDKEEKEGY